MVIHDGYAHIILRIALYNQEVEMNQDENLRSDERKGCIVFLLGILLLLLFAFMAKQENEYYEFVEQGVEYSLEYKGEIRIQDGENITLQMLEDPWLTYIITNRDVIVAFYHEAPYEDRMRVRMRFDRQGKQIVVSCISPIDGIGSHVGDVQVYSCAD